MPRVVQTPVQIANLALAVIQAQPISSFDEDSEVARLMKLYYDTVLRQAFELYPWQFSLKQVRLQRMAQPLLPQYKYSYKLPADFIHLRWFRHGTETSVDNHDLKHYELVNADVVCMSDEPEIWCKYQYEAAVPLYPTYFINLIVALLVDEVAAVFGANLTLQNQYHERAYGKNGKIALALRHEREQNPMDYQRIAPNYFAGIRQW